MYVEDDDLECHFLEENDTLHNLGKGTEILEPL